MIGKILAHYKILSHLGKGGMGEVYQAKDQKLGRDVAIKVLPEEFANDADRVARFQREAKLLASLNHPNIAAIHGLEESDETHFLVLELIEGDTLADRIKSGPIPVEESLKLALQIAEALEAAHDKGVIHRDLKPANIKVTPDGKVKVLDFGLAKAFAGDREDMNLSNSPTLSAAATQQGVILGTAAYMSPEQAKGKIVDKKTDIWSFGCVLFEMLIGKAAFQGDEAGEILASVIKGNTDLNLLPANVHPRVRELLSRCLQKELRKRYPDIADARYEIEQVLADPHGTTVQPLPMTEPRARLRQMLPWIAAAAALAAIIAGAAVWNLRPILPAESRDIGRFYHDLPEDQVFTNPGRTLVAVSPDGKKIVYVANQRLYLRNLNEPAAKPIQGTDENPANPFFSPDSQWVGFWSGAGSQLKKISVSGGAPVTLCNTSALHGATWGANKTIVFGTAAGIMGIQADSGNAELLVDAKEDEYVYGPQILPGGGWILFTMVRSGATSWDAAEIIVQSLKTGERKTLGLRGSDARYIPTGHLVYALGGMLYAIRFDVDSLEVRGRPEQIVEGIQRAADQSTGTANYGFSDTGTLVYVAGNAGVLQKRNLVWVDREGRETLLNAPSDYYYCPKISPDGRRVALSIDRGGNPDIYIWDLIQENRTRLTFDEGSDSHPLWAPDGQRIFFGSARDGNSDIYWKAADGSGKVERFVPIPDMSNYPFSWSVDGNSLVILSRKASNYDISVVSMADDHQWKELLNDEYNEIYPHISPDGRWISYMSDETGRREVYVRPFPDVDKGMWQVSDDGGFEPIWSPDGRELFYRGLGSNMDAVMAVSVETEPAFSRGKFKILFRRAYIYEENINWDIHPDGDRFLMMKAVEATDDESALEAPRKINIVLNWFEELKERVPVD